MKQLLFFIILTATAMAASSCLKSRPWDQDYYSYTDGFCLDGKEFHRNESKWDKKRKLVGFSRDSLYHFIYAAIMSDSRDYRAKEKYRIEILAAFDSLSFVDGYCYSGVAEEALSVIVNMPFMGIENGRRSNKLPYVKAYLPPYYITGGRISFWIDRQPIDTLYPSISEYRISRIAYEFEAEDENGGIHHITDGYAKAE